jgi:hypothetical protein
LLVLEAVDEDPHAEVELLVRRVVARLGSVSKQAVYDTMRTLATAGLGGSNRQAPLPAMRLGSATTTTLYAEHAARRPTSTVPSRRRHASSPRRNTDINLTKQK